MKIRALFFLLSSLLALSSAPTFSQPTPDSLSVKQQLNDYLWNAARDGNIAVINDFISTGYNMNVQDSHGYTAVILAAYHGHQEIVTRLIHAGADPCLRDNRGNTALMGAIFKGEISIARRLIAAKCSPDIQNKAGQTAAMYASLFQQHELLAKLEARGADMTITDTHGNSVATLSTGEINTGK
ncbi:MULTISPECIES: ankyrin repeat domain-containing protein [Edwardsiella]|uniref:Ankyrin n=2 Tax=Edwardsiella anguillarum TaxID=1821960 RepID=A0A076LML8_9GAMM|nr:MULTISPECIES: ankyrin repeat domain-containing protein [Edwardsiella]AKM48137.1 ankyrin [Edwardsiella sp. EA181011]GAJ66657.1 ankyrin [Edwardsiella piscicida]AIJ09760.1 ankyrin [Edwardsiella anguillarum ET080813]AKR77468.1 ankyrin repeat domain-containing protein [Edwardsiella sp. LADL05-105]KAB0592698.1 ankyrin repeat domain-containing protein [Edwardsiella anguillarum]